MRQLPLTPPILNVIRENIRWIAVTFQTDIVNIDEIGLTENGRKLSESSMWPIYEALDYFMAYEAIGKIVKENPSRGIKSHFRIISPRFFNIELNNLELPVRFDMDQRIKIELLAMSALYADIYDIENRLRFQLENTLHRKFGINFEPQLPRDVREDIKKQRESNVWRIEETRIQSLRFANFNKLPKILKMQKLALKYELVDQLCQRLEYINDARTRVAHNNPLPDDIVNSTHEKCKEVRLLIPQIV